MVRLTLKFSLACLATILSCTIVTILIQCENTVNHTFGEYASARSLKSGKYYEEINCTINGQYRVSCRKELNEVFVPFSFLEKYYEVYGKLVTHKGQDQFVWSHSYSKVYKPSSKYNSSGIFMYFNNYNVEVRDRVKCVSATEGVPVSTQWEASGYYYPVQVAQYGLSHYSKNITEPSLKQRLLEDGDQVAARWQVPNGAYIKRNVAEATSMVVEFNSRDTWGISLRLKPGTELVISVDILLYTANSSLTFLIEDKDRLQIFPVTFACSPTLIDVYDVNTTYGMGSCRRWIKLTRDLYVDLFKGHALSGRGKKLSRTRLRVISMSLKGYGLLDNLTMSTSDHISMFYSAADWLVRHQDANGGWPIGVHRKIASGRADLAPGWYSAMGQGQAMSALMRAYYISGQNQYLDAALLGMKPFSVPSAEGGVRTYFMNQYPWYEEYPTVPASFVLNGFIYSLIGLYDVLSLAPATRTGEAQLLFDQGMQSLKKLLPLFDTGSGSVYDLRHFTLSLSPNLARWDYHSTHVNQLFLLSTIDSDPMLLAVAERWASYMQGKRAPHN